MLFHSLSECYKFLARKPFECSYNFHEAQTFAIACYFLNYDYNTSFTLMLPGIRIRYGSVLRRRQISDAKGTPAVPSPETHLQALHMIEHPFSVEKLLIRTRLCNNTLIHDKNPVRISNC